MIKVFRLSDLIKYFLKFIIPIIIIIICLNIFIKKGEREQQKLQDKETANTNIKVEDTKEKSDTKQDDSKLSKLNEKYKSSKLKSNLLSLFKKKDNENKESINTKTADDNKNKDNKNKDNKNKDNKNKDNKNEENNNDGTNEKNKEKNKNKNKNNNNSNAYYFCINSEIVNLKNVKDETKINFTSLLKKIIQSEFEILNQSVNSNKDNDNNIGNSENSESIQNVENSESIENVENNKSSENIENNENSENSKLQTLTEYLLGLTPVQFNKNNKNNKSNGTQNANFKSADGKVIAQDKNQDGNNSSKIENEKNSENSKDGQNYNENNQNGEDNPIEQAEENVKTEAVSNNVNPRYNYDYNGIKIYNSTKYKLTNEMLDISNFSVNKDKILIYHTHTCESYTPTEKYNYQQSGNFRTTDLNFSVARVGEELKKQLESYNIKVIQNKTYHDYPSYNGSYSRSLTTANNMLNENKDADIVIDLHRDAIADSSYAPKVKIGDEYVSQMMFVIGTDIANSANSHWNENLKFAVKVQQKANEMYPRTI